MYTDGYVYNYTLVLVPEQSTHTTLIVNTFWDVSDHLAHQLCL
jgi:hypothetical protein